MKWFKKNEYYVDKSKTKLICEIGLSKLYYDSQNKNTYVCACSTIDNDSIRNEYTLIIFNDKHTLDGHDFPIEKRITISEIKEIKPSEYAIVVDDLINIHNRLEIRMGLYENALVTLQVSKKIVSVDSLKFQKSFLHSTRPFKTRLVFAEMNDTLREYAIDFEKKSNKT